MYCVLCKLWTAYNLYDHLCGCPVHSPVMLFLTKVVKNNFPIKVNLISSKC